MTTNQALSNIVQTTTAATPARTIHEHTISSAVECFDAAVDKNVAKHKEPLSAAVRRALPWGEGTLLKQIKDPEQAKAFSAFLDRERAEHPAPVRQERPKGPTPFSAAGIKARLEAAQNPFPLATDLYRNVRRWDTSETQQIEDVIIAVLGTAKRQEYVRSGIALSTETMAQAADDVKNFIARTKRSTQPRQTPNSRRPQSSSGGYRGPSNFSNHNAVERKNDGPKVTNKPSDLEKQAAELKETIARIEAALKVAPADSNIEGRVNARLMAIDVLKAKKHELADIRAKIAADHAARADAKKKERIANAAASSKASLTIPTSYKTKEKQAKPAEPTKGKKKR
jgi:hypothetical protein